MRGDMWSFRALFHDVFISDAFARDVGATMAHLLRMMRIANGRYTNGTLQWRLADDNGTELFRDDNMDA